MLPILRLLEFSKIVPLSEKSLETISFKPGINKFLAENGSGKTTLTDLIEHSLVRDAHAFSWNIFSKKRVDKTAFVKAEWLFGEESNIITHEFTDSGPRTRVTSSKFSNKALTRDMYSDFLYSRTNLDLEQLRKLFEGVYYKRENDLNLLGTPGEENLMDFFEILNKTIRMETPATIKLRNQIGEVKRQIELRKSNKRKHEAQLEKMEVIFSSAESSADGIDSLGDRKSKLELDSKKLRKDILQSQKTLEEIEEDDQKIIDELESFQEKILNVRSRLDELKSKRYDLVSKLEKQERELEAFKKLGNIDYSKIKAQWEQDQNCKLCGSMVFENWSDRIVKGCPSCGTAWKNIQGSIKEAISKEQGNIDAETRDIQKDIQKVEHELRTVTEDIDKLKREEKNHTDGLKSLRDKLASNNSRRRELQRKNEEINQKIQRIGVEIGSLSAQEKMVNQDESIGLLKVNLEKINSEIEKYTVQLEHLEKELPEQKELQHILNNFTRYTKEIFGYSMLADTENRIITITKDDSNRDFAAMSWSERYFIDVVFRIAIFNFLIDNKILKRGLIVLDSPEAALDPNRLELLAQIVNNHKTNIDFVIATRVKEFYNLLEGHPLDTKKQIQASLFDFIG